jgi:shikimate dehydrogenase
MTDRYAVIGNPISHSKSPQIHQMFAAQTGQDISYEKIEAPLDGFAATIERLRNEGYKGFSITVPFKFEAFKIATNLHPRSKSAKAVNTLWFNGNEIHGDNTDGAGLICDIQNNFRIDIKGKRVLLMGTGGAAWGVAVPLLLANAASVTIAYRNEAKAKEMLAELMRTADFLQLSLHNGQLVSRSYTHLIEAPITIGQQFDVAINATSSGLSDEMPPLPKNLFAPNALAYDMMYGRETSFMKFACEHGAHVADGLGMLVEQAAEAFYLWRGVRPDTAPVIAALRLT